MRRANSVAFDCCGNEAYQCLLVLNYILVLSLSPLLPLSFSLVASGLSHAVTKSQGMLDIRCLHVVNTLNDLLAWRGGKLKHLLCGFASSKSQFVLVEAKWATELWHDLYHLRKSASNHIVMKLPGFGSNE